MHILNHEFVGVQLHTHKLYLAKKYQIFIFSSQFFHILKNNYFFIELLDIRLKYLIHREKIIFKIGVFSLLF